VFIALGLPILQGYGLTETSPVACANSPADNLPASVGKAVPDIQIKLGDKNALMIRGPNVMMGYWQNDEATKSMIDADGWLNSGDTARIDETGHVFITGRLKEIIVMSNGEKVPPIDIEAAISRDGLFEQVVLIGEGKPYLSVLTALQNEQWKELAAEKGFSAEAAALRDERVQRELLARIAAQMKDFPGYAQVRRITATLDAWTVENGLLTPTLKLRRSRVMEKFQAELDNMYSGH
jgi:long-chain acyl-CoA synthetase